MSDVAASEPVLERDPFDARVALVASGPLRDFNRAGVLSAADVHVARRLGELGGENDPQVRLAVALAVRAPRIGHVLVDLSTIHATATVDTDEPLDLDALHWPAADEWVAAVAASPLVLAEGAEGVAPLRLRGNWLYLDRYWAEEVAVAGALRRMLEAPESDVEPAAVDAIVQRLFDGQDGGRQADAVAAAARQRFVVVAGGPGTGKTTTVARIAALLGELAGVGVDAADCHGAGGDGDGGDGGNDDNGARMPLIALAAPTGKAAARLQEAVHDEAADLNVPPALRDALLGLQASTIHRLLGWRPGSGSRFRHDSQHRLPHDVVIVDETSMVSLSLMSRLIEALRSDARLVLVGDPGQLASIEAGAVLGDIIAPFDGADADADHNAAARDAGGSVVVLDRGHRFGGSIADLAAAIRAGDDDEVMALLRAGADDVVWIDADAGAAQAPAVVRTEALRAARATLHAARDGNAAVALEALASFRILCAHRRGPYGVAGWIGRVEGWLEEEAAGFSTGERWYLGRPLLVTENDYELGLANGDTGVVLAAGEDRVMAGFPRGSEIVLHSPSRLGAVDTVHAMTIHKSQGSQFAQAAVLLPEPDSRILTRELLYTAATRAQERLILVGPEETIRAAVARRVARASGLATRLWG